MSKENILEALQERVNQVAGQIDEMFRNESRAFGMPEWYNHHDYASGAFKAKHDALHEEFFFLHKLIGEIREEAW